MFCYFAWSLMLISLCFKNFYSFAEETEIDFTVGKQPTASGFDITLPGRRLNKVIAVVGANGAAWRIIGRRMPAGLVGGATENFVGIWSSTGLLTQRNGGFLSLNYQTMRNKVEHLVSILTPQKGISPQKATRCVNRT